MTSNPVPVHPRWEPLAEPKTIEDVLRGIDQVLKWSIKEKSTIGYFAVLYKRVTLGIRQAINRGEFDDGARIERLDVAFARRYFNALNTYFCPDRYECELIGLYGIPNRDCGSFAAGGFATAAD